MPLVLQTCSVSILTNNFLFHFCSEYLKFPTVHHHNRFMAVFQDHSGKPVPVEDFWTFWCKGRLTKADTLTIRLGATPSGLTSAHLHHPPIFFYGPDALPAAQPTVTKHWRQMKFPLYTELTIMTKTRVKHESVESWFIWSWHPQTCTFNIVVPYTQQNFAASVPYADCMNTTVCCKSTGHFHEYHVTVVYNG